MAEAQYIHPTVDPLDGVQEGLNIFERLQRIKQTEQEGKRLAEQHITNKLLDTTNLKIKNLAVKQAEDDRRLREGAANEWLARSDLLNNRITQARALSNDPIKQMQAVDDIEADFADITAHLPDVAKRVSTIAAGIRETARLGFASRVATGKTRAWKTLAEAESRANGYEVDQVYDPVAGEQYVISGRLDMRVVAPLLQKIRNSQKVDELNSLLAEDGNAALSLIPEIGKVYSDRRSSLELADKKAKDDEMAEVELQQKQLNVEETQGKIAAQRASAVGKRQEVRELALETRTTINEIRFFRSKSESGKENVANAVGAIQGSKPARLYNRLLAGDREDNQRRLLKLVQMDILSLTKFLRPISEGELDFLRQSVPDINSSDETWMGYLERKQRLMETALANMEDPNFDPDSDSSDAGGRSPGLAPAADGAFSADQLEAAARGQ